GVQVGDVDVGKRDAAAGAVGGGRAGDAGGLVERGGRRGRAGHDGGLIIGAGDGDGDVLRDAAAMAVGDGDRVGDRERLAGGEEVERAVGDGVGPADGLGAVVDGAEAQRTRIRNVGGCAAALVPDRGVEAGRGGVQVEIGRAHV